MKAILAKVNPLFIHTTSPTLAAVFAYYWVVASGCACAVVGDGVGGGVGGGVVVVVVVVVVVEAEITN